LLTYNRMLDFQQSVATIFPSKPWDQFGWTKMGIIRESMIMFSSVMLCCECK